MLLPAPVRADDPPAAPAAPAPDPGPDSTPAPAPAAPAEPTAPEPVASGPVYETVITATTPLHGARLPADHVPANVQTVTAADLADHKSLDLSTYAGEALGSVHINDVQSNP